MLADPTITKVFHNAAFDLSTPLLYGKVNGIADTNIMAKHLDYEFTSLEALASEVNMEAVSARTMLGKGQTMADIPMDEVGKKCCVDTAVTYALYQEFSDRVDKSHYDIDIEVLPLLIDMAVRGIKIDQEARQQYEDKLEAELAIYKQVAEHEGLSISSPKQVAIWLSHRGIFLPRTQKGANLSTKEEVLKRIDDPAVGLILAYRKAKKLLSTYIKPMAEADRFGTEYYIDTVIGRFSSKNRNIQNIPPEARHLFIPDNGVFTSGDYSQEHLRILAYWSQDKEMLKIYNNGGDIHQYTADRIGISRHLAKTINYAITYGATAETIMEQARIKDVEQAQHLLDGWKSVFRAAAYWLEEAQRYGLRTGYTLPTLFGRSIKLPTNEGRLRIARKAANYPIIGSDAEIMKRALIICKDLPLAITVHDSITCDGDIAFPLDQLEYIAPFRIPFEVKQTTCWA
jgi:DNA polymerase-1